LAFFFGTLGNARNAAIFPYFSSIAQPISQPLLKFPKAGAVGRAFVFSAGVVGRAFDSLDGDVGRVPTARSYAAPECAGNELAPSPSNGRSARVPRLGRTCDTLRSLDLNAYSESDARKAEGPRKIRPVRFACGACSGAGFARSRIDFRPPETRPKALPAPLATPGEAG